MLNIFCLPFCCLVEDNHNIRKVLADSLKLFQFFCGIQLLYLIQKINNTGSAEEHRRSVRLPIFASGGNFFHPPLAMAIPPLNRSFTMRGKGQEKIITYPLQVLFFWRGGLFSPLQLIAFHTPHHFYSRGGSLEKGGKFA